MNLKTDVTPILQTAFSFWSSKVLLTAVEFGLFTRLGGRRLTGGELGAELKLYDPIKHAENKSDRFGTKILRPPAEIHEEDAVNLVMKAGEFIIFSERIMHGAAAQHHPRRRPPRHVRPLHRPRRPRPTNPYVLGDAGLSISYLRIQQLRLDRWRPILVRGEDRSHVNGDRVIRYKPGMVINK